MDEKEFSALVTSRLNTWDLADLELVTSHRLTAGFTAWWADDTRPEPWTWAASKREIDLCIGKRVEVDGEQILLPVVAIELKTGSNNTDAFDTKSAIYEGLRELYPFVCTVLLVAGYKGRNYSNLMRNARGFDFVLSDWGAHGNDKTAQMLKKIVETQISYFGYWSKLGPSLSRL